ncbi:MAG TPA: plastocyanin/azurin family copper-binding protein [Conexibacter sp.]|jgi:plastocyanin|nr:plastocyanin/azurin family copper-binding protein [Conexibacter sp.]
MAVSLTTLRRRSALAGALLLVSGTLAACGGGSSTTSSTSGGGSAAASSTSSSGSSTSGGGSTGSSSTAAPSTSSSGSAASTTSSAGGGSALDISAVEGSGSLGFSSRALTARAGTVTIRLANGSGDSFPHGIAIEGMGVDKDGKVVQPGGTSSVTLRLKPGRYTFYCPVSGHRAQGMAGTLTVT